MSGETEGIKVGANVGLADVEIRGGRRVVESADRLAAALVDMAGFLPRLTANYANELLERQKGRFKAVADKAMPHIERIPNENRQEPSDKIKRAIVLGAAVEDDPDIQEIWARFLARAADGRRDEPNILLANTIEKMSKVDLSFFQELHEGLNESKSILLGRRTLFHGVFSGKNLRDLSAAEAEQLDSYIASCNRELIETAPAIVTQLAKDNLLVLGIVAPVSRIDKSSLQYLKFQRHNLYSLTSHSRDADTLLREITKELARINGILNYTFDTVGEGTFRLTNLGSKLYEIALGEPIANQFNVTRSDVFDAIGKMSPT